MWTYTAQKSIVFELFECKFAVKEKIQKNYDETKKS